MRLVTFRKGKETRIGAIVGDQVLDLARASKAAGKPPLPTDMIAFLEMGAKGMALARSAIAFAKRTPGKAHLQPLRRTRLEAPVPCPRKLFALARNYVSHAVESGEGARDKREMTPRVFMKPPSTTVNRPGGDIVLSRYAHWVDWEVELAIVIGRKARDVSVKDAARRIAGYTIVNDVSERDFCVQKRTKDEPFDHFFDWLNGKWPDGFAPMGPCITTADELPEPLDLAVRLAVNGVMMQEANASQLIFSCPELVSFISRYVTLEPGDVIATGTPSGIGKTQGLKLKPGDLVRCEIEGIGVLENPVVRERRSKR